MTTRAFCDGVSRRDVLRVGTCSAMGLGLTLPRLLQAAETRPDKRDVSLIYVFLQGGLSTIDTFDLKPQAPAEFRGEFQPIPTNVAGVQIGEDLPRLAREMDKVSLIRSFGHHNSDHGPANHYVLTGYFPTAGFNPSLKPNNQRPSIGSTISRKLGPRGSVPPYVCVPKMENCGGAAYLGSSAAPFVVEADPNAPNFSVPDLLPPVTVDTNRLVARRDLIRQVDRFQQAAEARANSGAQALSVFQQKAFDLMTSSAAKSAFDIREEPTAVRDQYGRTSLGQSCLMARRLVEAGVRCVTIDHSNWDTHNNNFSELRNELLPQLDNGLGSLLRDLSERGMLDSTLVVVTGEFGRTPRINKDAGRDHWGPSSTIFLAGGGVQGGTVYGASSDRAERPAYDPVGPEDLSATIFTCLGINPDDEFYTAEGRPVKIANNGRPVRDILRSDV